MKPFATIGITLPSSTTTASSAPTVYISTFGLRVVLLAPFRLPLHHRFTSPSPKPIYGSCHLHTEHPYSLYNQAEHLYLSPDLVDTWFLSVVYIHFDASTMVLLQSAPIYTPDTFISTPPFYSSIQHRPHCGAAPEYGLVSAPDSSLPVSQFLCRPYLQGF